MLLSKIKEIKNGRVIVKDSQGDVSRYKGFFITERAGHKFVIVTREGDELATTLSMEEAKGLIDLRYEKQGMVK